MKNTFNDLAKGVNQNETYYIGSKEECMSAIKSEKNHLHYYIVNDLLPDHLRVYINISSYPNGIAQYGKIYEGKSKKIAIKSIEHSILPL